MKRLAMWAGVCIGTVFLQLAVTFWFLVPHIDDRAYVIQWWFGDVIVDATGWHALTPYYAWPILATYGGALVALAVVAGLAVWYYKMQRERRAIASREAAVGLQEAQVRIDMAESKRIREAAQSQVQAAMEEVARREQEAAAQVEDAKARMQGSVDTNIGRQRTIQNLRGQVTKLEAELQDLRKRVNGLKRRRTGE